MYFEVSRIQQSFLTVWKPDKSGNRHHRETTMNSINSWLVVGDLVVRTDSQLHEYVQNQQKWRPWERKLLSRYFLKRVVARLVFCTLPIYIPRCRENQLGNLPDGVGVLFRVLFGINRPCDCYYCFFSQKPDVG